MESDIYVKLAEGATVDSLREKLAERYADEPFVCVLPKVCCCCCVGQLPGLGQGL